MVVKISISRVGAAPRGLLLMKLVSTTGMHVTVYCNGSFNAFPSAAKPLVVFLGVVSLTLECILDRNPLL